MTAHEIVVHTTESKDKYAAVHLLFTTLGSARQNCNRLPETLRHQAWISFLGFCLPRLAESYLQCALVLLVLAAPVLVSV